MLFKLSLRNLKKSFKDYTIYFLTLVLGVAIFYMFNSLDSQQAMLVVSKSTVQLLDLMISLLNWISIFVAVVLGLLILYANRFLINRRKKEFGTYMVLGMGRRQISRILLLETVIIGIISLASGLVIGIFASQFMTVLVAKLFAADMTRFEFVFSQAALVKTCVYFAVMYAIVIVFNVFAISKYKLITLLTAIRKNEKVKIKSTFLSVLLFIISCLMLGYAYWKVTVGILTISGVADVLTVIAIGTAATILFFFSLSGFLLKVIQMRKKTYLKDTNMFVLRQLNNKINTTVIGMSIICIMLFLTITILSFSLSMNNSMKQSAEALTPVDINYIMEANIPEEYENYLGNIVKNSSHEVEASRKPITEILKDNGLDMNVLKDIIELPIYSYDKLTWEASLGEYAKEAKEKYPSILFDTKEDIVKLSDYNRLAKLYGKDTLTLEDNQYAIIADFDNMARVRNNALAVGQNTISINGKEYISKYNTCKEGFIIISAAHMNTGVIIVPDSCNLTENMISERLLAANYNATSDEEKERIEELIVDPDGTFAKTLSNKGINLDGETKISIIKSSFGVTTVIIFISIYLGIIFLIASAAVLALKQLTESSDNKQRYDILRKIGCDEKLINKSLFWQIGIFFLIPLILAGVHSIFGIQFLLNLLGGVDKNADLVPSILSSIGIIGGVYIAYLYATYTGSKEIIKG